MPNQNDSELSLFKITTLNPMMAFVVYKNDAFREPMLGASYSILDDGSIKLGARSRKNYFEIRRAGFLGIIPREWLQNFGRMRKSL